VVTIRPSRCSSAAPTARPVRLPDSGSQLGDRWTVLIVGPWEATSVSRSFVDALRGISQKNAHPDAPRAETGGLVRRTVYPEVPGPRRVHAHRGGPHLREPLPARWRNGSIATSATCRVQDKPTTGGSTPPDSTDRDK